MSYNLTQQINIVNKHSNVDLHYGPYASKKDACDSIPRDIRDCGKTVLIGKNVGTEEKPEYINVQEFWWSNGIEDDDLIVKTDLIILDDTNIIAPMVDGDRFYLNIEIGQKFIWKGSYKYWDDGVPHSLVTNGIYICFYNEIMDYNDYKLIFCLTTPYISEYDAAKNIFPREVRYIGMTVNIDGKEYWFKGGIDDEDLVIKGVQALSASDISYNGSVLDESITDVLHALYYALTNSRTVDTNLKEAINLSTKITNVVIDDENYVNGDSLIFDYMGQNECTIVIYNNSDKSIGLPFSFSTIGDYNVVSVNGITSVTLLSGSSCEISMLFTKNECRMIIMI